MSALLSTQVQRTPERFSRTLGERNACVRSSSVEIVPLPDPPLHLADRIVLWGCGFGAVSMVVMACLGWLS